MANVELGDGTKVVRVTPDRELMVSVAPYPDKIEQLTHPLRQYFTIDGTLDGDNNMGQDGSSNNIEFFVKADEEDDIYITHISLIVGYGTTGQPFQFGDGAALTNGVELVHESKHDMIQIHDAIKSNQDLFRLANGSFGTDWELRGVGASNDYGYFTSINLGQFAPYFGIKLDAGSNQRLCFVIKDSMAAVSGVNDSFNAIAHGFYRFD